jgi:PKHD-type hydroxylase|tara:strand:- start:7 stop:561 length:555 start_codon:yes stop_codon:yes gene_type:complete
LEKDITWWRFDNAIDSKMCNKIIKLAEKKWETATTKGKKAQEQRKTNICWTTEQWLYDIVFEYMRSANQQSGWNFEIDAAESMQIGKYSKGCFYDYHTDGDGVTIYDEPENKWLHNKTRKLSMTILLNEDYEGGNFKFYDNEEDTIKGKGSVLVFPSYLQHCVEKITKGNRYSLVVWFLGPKFK